MCISLAQGHINMHFACISISISSELNRWTVDAFVPSKNGSPLFINPMNGSFSFPNYTLHTDTHTHGTAQKCRLHTVHSRKKEMRECQCVTLCGHHPMVGNIFYYVYIIQYWCERKALRNMNHSIHPHSRSERWNPYSYTYREREKANKLQFIFWW